MSLLRFVGEWRHIGAGRNHGSVRQRRHRRRLHNGDVLDNHLSRFRQRSLISSLIGSLTGSLRNLRGGLGEQRCLCDFERLFRLDRGLRAVICLVFDSGRLGIGEPGRARSAGRARAV